MGFNRIPLQPDTLYHFYNHAVGKDNLFYEQRNYRYFLEKYAEHMHGCVETFCYCLMPNHFHILARVRPEAELLSDMEKSARKPHDTVANFLAHRFGSFQNAYAKAMNNSYGRKGSLFMQSFGRKEIHHDAYLTNIIKYIHGNAVHHGFVKRAEDWEHSSYHAYLGSKASRLNRAEVLDWFGGQARFQEAHSAQEPSLLDNELEFDIL